MNIRNRIAILVGMTGFLTSIVLSLVVFMVMHEQAMGIIDFQLQNMATEVTAQLKMMHSGLPGYEEKTQITLKRYWIKVYDQDKKVLFQSDLAKLVDLPLQDVSDSYYFVRALIPGGQVFLNQEKEEMSQFKVFVVNRFIAERTYVIQIAKPIKDLEDEIIDVIPAIGAGLAVSTLLLAFVSYAMAGRILEPISLIVRMARKIDENTLDQRIPTGDSRDEIHELATQLNQMFDRLQYSFSKQKHLIASASHELKSPLSMLRLFFEEIRENHEFPLSLHHQIETQEKQVLRMDRMIRVLLELAVLEGQSSLVPEPFDFSEMLNSLIEDFSLVMERKHITMESTVPDNLVLKGDRDRIRRAMINLLDNAVGYNTENGKIIMGLKTENQICHLILSNTGPGIPPEDLPRVFDQFYRVEKSRSVEHGGAGLGLSIVREIIRLHKGTLTIESDPAEWTTVRLNLPMNL